MNIQEELRIADYQPLVGLEGTELHELFSTEMERVGNLGASIPLLMSTAYNYGVRAGKREERAKRKKR